MKKEVIGIFPTPVLLYYFDSQISQQELDLINSLEKRRNVGNSASVENQVLNLPNFTKLKKFIDQCLDDYVQSILMPENDIKLFCTESWINYAEIGKYHHQHNHPNSIVSGVFYFQAEKNKDSIIFSKDEYDQIVVYPKSLNSFNTKVWRVGVETNLLILFPSCLKHEVARIEEERQRISLAFNTFYQGKIGSPFNNTHLDLSNIN